MRSYFSEITNFLTTHLEYLDPLPDPPLEEILRQSLTEADLISLNLSPFLLPQIIRPLPRLYLQTDPRLSKIKEPFRNLSHLKRHYIDRPLLDLYRSLPMPSDATIVLATWVIPDGMGDYYTQREAARILHDAFPNLSITLVTLLHRDRTPPVQEGPWRQYLIPYSGPLNGPIVPEKIPDSLNEILRRADLILEIPTPFPPILSYSESIKMGEHSLIESFHYHPSTKNRCMGLHFLEKGIFTKRPSPCQRENLSPLYEQLFQTSFPTKNQITSYFNTHTFDFAYTKTFRGTYLYLCALLSSLKKSSKDIDICLFDMPLFSHVWKKKFTDSSQLISWNIAEVHLYYQRYFVPIRIAPTGKILRLIHCQNIPQHQVLGLMSLSQHLIGCTGDQSVLEAIATAKPFFYDPPPFKRPFLKDLSAIAEKKIPGPLSSFFRLCLQNSHLPLDDIQCGWVTEEHLDISSARLALHTDEEIALSLGQHLHDPAFINSFQILKHILNQEYPFEPSLIGLVNRAIYHSRSPHLAQR